MAKISAASLLIGLAIAIWGISLIYDPWSQERFERRVRENARLEPFFFPYIEFILENLQIYGWALLIAAFFIMNKFTPLYIISIPLVLSYGFVYHSPFMFKSERFGGNQMILGVLFFLAVFSTIDLAAQSKKQKKKEKKKKNQTKH